MATETTQNELDGFEARLRNRWAGTPSAYSRNRVLTAIIAELNSPQPLTVFQWDLRYWAAAAAGVLLILNVSLSAAVRDGFAPAPSVNAHHVAADLWAAHEFEIQQERNLK